MLNPSLTLTVTKDPTATTFSAPAWWRLQRQFVQRESTRWFLIELAIFGLLAALSLWPMIQTVQAFRLL